MKKISVILASLVLFAGVSFASPKQDQTKGKKAATKKEKKATPAKAKKAAPAKEKKGAKADKKAAK